MIILTSLLCISSSVAGMEGMEMHPMIFSGAPASTAASRIRVAAFSVHFAADGCGENTIAFLALIAMIDLKIAVDVGFVEGTIPISRPTGSATSIVLAIGSSLTIPIVFMSLMASYSNVEAI